MQIIFIKLTRSFILLVSFILFIFLETTPVLCQEKESDEKGQNINTTENKVKISDKYKKYLGFGTSSFSGYGFMYQHYLFSSDYRLRYSGFILGGDTGNSTEVNANAGILLRKDIANLFNTFNFYSGLGTEYEYSQQNGSEYYSNSEVHSNSLGFLLGLDFIFWKRININLEVGLQYERAANTNNQKVVQYIGPGAGIGISVGLGND